MRAAEYFKKYGLERIKSDLSIVEKHGFNSFFTEQFVAVLHDIIEQLDDEIKK